MSTIWNLVASFALPTPLLMLVLLNVPLPKPFKRGVLIFVSRVFDMPLIGVFKTLHVMLFLLALAFFSTVRTLQVLQNTQLSATPFATPNYEIAHLSKRWRAERNLWLAAFAFTMWVVLAAFYRELGRRMRLEERLAEFEASDFTVDTTREASVSREVSSRPNLVSPRKLSASPAPSPVKAAPPAAGRPPKAPAPVRESPEIEMIAPVVEQLVKKDL